MINLIIKSNNWYDNLPEGKRLGFFLSVIMGSLLFTQYLMVSGKFIWAFPIWVIVFTGWRIAGVFINWHKWYKKQK